MKIPKNVSFKEFTEQIYGTRTLIGEKISEMRTSIGEMINNMEIYTSRKYTDEQKGELFLLKADETSNKATIYEQKSKDIETKYAPLLQAFSFSMTKKAVEKARDYYNSQVEKMSKKALKYMSRANAYGQKISNGRKDWFKKMIDFLK